MKNKQLEVFNQNPELIERLLVITDIQRGFIEKGMTLADPRIAHIIPGVIELTKDFKNKEDQLLFLLDTHTPNAAEFNRKVGFLPPHCIEGTDEALIMPELAPYAKNEWTLRKNTTMIYTLQLYRDALDKMRNLKEVVFVGDCSDICVIDGAIPTKKHFEQQDRLVDVIVPTSLVDTFDIPGHNREEMNRMTKIFLNQAGILTPEVYERKRVR